MSETLKIQQKVWFEMLKTIWKGLRERNNEVWHYICENGHKWESYSSPGGGVYAPSTTCPECGTTICMGNVYINGKKTCAGACHIEMIDKQRVKRGKKK